jgi:glycosyltransferase involved in cell wall biosynthesis
MLGAFWDREVTVIRNGHDDHPPAPMARDQPFTLAYLGTYYPETQDLSALWHAIRTCRTSAGPYVDQIRFVGDLSPRLAEELDHAGLAPLVHSTGFLAHDQALAEVSNATALIVAGPKDLSGTLRGQVAAKLSEYLATGRPIIYVGDPGGDAAALLANYPGTHVVPTGDSDAARQALDAVRSERVVRDVKDLSRHALAGQLAGVLDQVAGY